MKATEQYFHVVLFIMLYKMILTSFKSVDETLVCDHLNECYRAVLSSGAVCFSILRKRKFEIFLGFELGYTYKVKGFKLRYF